MSHPDQVSQWKCSECGVLKGPANHWFQYHTARVLFARVTVLSTIEEKLPDEFVFRVSGWPPAGMEPTGRVVCGERCLHTALSKALEKKSDTPASPRSHSYDHV